MTAWERLKRFFGFNADDNKQAPDTSNLGSGSQRTQDPTPGDGHSLPDIGWIEATDNPWGVRILDVRPVTLGMLSVSADPTCASNAVSFGGEPSLSFIGQEPLNPRTVPTRLTFRIDRPLFDGVLFTPSEMEHKWALFYHHAQIICVRSWTRQVHVIAQVEQHADHIEITSLNGTFADSDEAPILTQRILEFLLRSHALNKICPAPLPAGLETQPEAAAMWCMSMFGNRAHFATPHPIEGQTPEKPLRTQTLLHIGVARGDVEAIDSSLRAGVPLDLLARDGLAPLHWALSNENLDIMTRLLERGSPVDVRSAEGATPLMNAVQQGRLDAVALLLERGAAANATDHRGFTALHRAAELGHGDIVKRLLAHGAYPAPVADGHTPLSLAEARGNGEIAAILSLLSPG